MKLYIKKNVIKYDELYKKGHDHSYPNLDLVRLSSIFLNKGNTNVLDYGFGPGENLIHLHRSGFKVFGAEASDESIKLINEKIKKKNIDIDGKKIVKINEQIKELPFKDNFFDNIVCTSVISLLETKENIIKLIDEFFRILKVDGKLIVDINGPDSSFRKNGKLISEDTYETYIEEKNQTISTYCPSDIKIFSKLFHKYQIVELGEIKYKYFDFKEHEYIACLKK